MKTTLFPLRALTLLALASVAAGCASSSGTPTPLPSDAGADSRDTGGNVPDAAIDTRDGGGSDTRDAGIDSRDVGVDTDAHETATPAIAVAQGTFIVTAGAAASLNGVVVGTTSSTPFSIANTGNAPLSIGGVTVTGSDFSLGALSSSSVAAGASAAFTIIFNPTNAGLKNGSVTIANNSATGDFTFPIVAQATDAPVAAISVSVDGTTVASAGTAAYGAVTVGSSSAKTFTIHNGGTADLILSGAPVVAGGAFALTTSPASLTVAAGASVSAVITFAPTTTGDQTGSVTIANNTGAAPSYVINLTGTGMLVVPTGFTVTGAAGASSINGVGGTLQLTAAVVPSGAADPGVTWSSGTASVATVDATGLVTAVGAGTSVITATAADGSGVTGTLTITVTVPFVYFVKQALGTTTASLAGGAFAVSSTYGTSGNAFKYVLSPTLVANYYGTTSNGFIAFPTTMTGDFSITAQVTVTTQIKASTTCGIGLGMTTGFNGTDSYAYILLRNMTNAVNGTYVSASANVASTSVGSPNLTFTNGTPLQLTFSRTGSNVTYGAGPVGGTLTTTTTATSLLTNGTVYGNGPVYPALSFNNVAATITNLVIKDANGNTVYDSATGALVTYVPAALTLSSGTASMLKQASTAVTATANAVGGAVSGVTAVAADTTVVSTSVTNGASNSTINLTGLKGGFTTVTVTNTGDTNSATNTKTIAVSVFDYQTTDGYGSLAAVAYPVPGATNAYTDGELALTFDGPPTLSQGGTIKIMKASDGTEVDSIAFAGETLTYGTTAINVDTQLVRVSGNTVFFTPHLGKLAYGTGYYVAMPTISIAGNLNGVTFNGLSNVINANTWSFTTRAAPTLTATNITVDGAQNSAANFRTVGGALGALPGLPAGTTSATINIAAGTYNELVHYTGPGAATPLTVNIVGPTGNTRGDSCVIQYANGNSRNGTTQTRASFYLASANFVLQNITVKNTAVRAQLAQAESLYFNGPGFTLAANNSSFFSNQDTIQTSGRSWFYNCYVEGNVDFIWGTGDAALFESCSLRFVNDVGGTGTTSYSLFVARTGTTIATGGNGTVGKGYVLLNSGVSVDANVSAFFGRDAGVGSFYDQAALINVIFTGAGTIGAGIWNVTTAPLSLGDSTFVGWKSAMCSGLNLGTLTTDVKTSAVIANQTAEYGTRDEILNRVVTVTGGVPVGYQAAAAAWDVSSLATAFNAPP